MSLYRHFSENAARLLAGYLDDTKAVHALVVDAAGVVIAANQAMADLLGEPLPSLDGRPVRELLTDPDGDRLVERLGAADVAPGERLLLNFVDVEHAPHTLECRLGACGDGVVILGERVVAREETLRRELLELNNTLAVLSRESARKGRELQAANTRLEETLEELNRSFWHLRKIQEVLPVCMECGKIKTADASWEPIIDYLRKNSLLLSHGYCPECVVKVREALGLPPREENQR